MAPFRAMQLSQEETGTVRKDGPFQDHNIVFPSWGRKQNCEKGIRETTLVKAPANQKIKYSTYISYHTCEFNRSNFSCNFCLKNSALSVEAANGRSWEDWGVICDVLPPSLRRCFSSSQIAASPGFSASWSSNVKQMLLHKWKKKPSGGGIYINRLLFNKITH